MKKIFGIASLALLMSATVAQADGRYRNNNNSYTQNNYYYGRNNNSNWVAPAIGLGILGGIIVGSTIYNAPPPPQYYYAPPPPPLQCWNQSFYDNYGRLYVERVCE